MQLPKMRSNLVFSAGECINNVVHSMKYLTIKRVKLVMHAETSMTIA